MGTQKATLRDYMRGLAGEPPIEEPAEGVAPEPAIAAVPEVIDPDLGRSPTLTVEFENAGGSAQSICDSLTYKAYGNLESFNKRVAEERSLPRKELEAVKATFIQDSELCKVLDRHRNLLADVESQAKSISSKIATAEAACSTAVLSDDFSGASKARARRDDLRQSLDQLVRWCDEIQNELRQAEGAARIALSEALSEAVARRYYVGQERKKELCAKINEVSAEYVLELDVMRRAAFVNLSQLAQSLANDI